MTIESIVDSVAKPKSTTTTLNSVGVGCIQSIAVHFTLIEIVLVLCSASICAVSIAISHMAATRPVTSAGSRGVEAIFLSPADEVTEEGESVVSASRGIPSAIVGGGSGSGGGGGGQQKQQELWTRQQQQPQPQPRQQQAHEVRFREENDSVTTTSNEAHYGSKSSQKPFKDAGKTSTSDGKVGGGRRVSIQQQNGDEDDDVVQQLRHPLRKSRSVSDVQAAENYASSSVTSSVTSLMGASPSQLKENKKQNQQRRRMSISITSTSNTQSRRSSIGGGSIIISLSRPDSPVPFIISQSPTNDDDDDDQHQSLATASDALAAEGVGVTASPAAADASGKANNVAPHLLLMADESLEFLRIRRTAATVPMATRFRTSESTLYPPGSGPSSSTGGGKLSNIIDRRRRGSTPSVPRLNLKDEDMSQNRSGSGGASSESSRRVTRKAQRRRTSSGGSSHRGYFLPASRPSSVMAEASVLAYHQQQQLDLSRSTSPVTIAAVQIGKGIFFFV
jgi:hypothetical protein